MTKSKHHTPKLFFYKTVFVVFDLTATFCIQLGKSKLFEPK